MNEPCLLKLHGLIFPLINQFCGVPYGRLCNKLKIKKKNCSTNQKRVAPHLKNGSSYITEFICEKKYVHYRRDLN